MNIKKVLKFFNYYNFTNHYKNIILHEFLFKKLNLKRKIILKNSFSKELLTKKFNRNKINIEQFRIIFFETGLFPYTLNKEKENLINILKKNCEQEISKYLNYADKILQNQLIIFNEHITFQEKINWFYGFSNNFFWPIKDSDKFNIRPLNNIDVKYVWELNRHQFLTYLGFAYYLSNEKKYAIQFKKIILDWIRKNPPLVGVNWTSGLEISLRLISWIFTLYFFRDCSEINNNRFFNIILNSMYQHAYYLRFFYTRRNFNHTIGELFGVFLFSKIFNKINIFKKWNKKIYKRFISQIYLQIREDGTNIEQSINYHRFVLEFFVLFYILEGNKLQKKASKQIENMFDFYLNTIKPNGEYPLFGDNDDGKLLLLSFYEKNPYNYLINLGTILFQRGDFKFLSKKIEPISILLTGNHGFNKFHSIKETKPKKKCRYYENAGYLIIKNDFNENSNYLFIDYGKFGPRNAAHSHSSIGNFIFSFEGSDIIIDLGTFSYNRDWIERNYFRSSIAHNIISINQRNQALIDGWFSWKMKPRISRKLSFFHENISFLCEHDGYKDFIVKREINTNISIDQIIIKDTIIPFFRKNKSIKIDLNFYFNKEIELKIEENRIITNKNIFLEIIAENNIEISIQKSDFSPTYGIKYTTNNLNIHAEIKFENKKQFNITTNIRKIN